MTGQLIRFGTPCIWTNFDDQHSTVIWEIAVQSPQLTRSWRHQTPRTGDFPVQRAGFGLKLSSHTTYIASPHELTDPSSKLTTLYLGIGTQCSVLATPWAHHHEHTHHESSVWDKHQEIVSISSPPWTRFCELTAMPSMTSQAWAYLFELTALYTVFSVHRLERAISVEQADLSQLTPF